MIEEFAALDVAIAREQTEAEAFTLKPAEDLSVFGGGDKEPTINIREFKQLATDGVPIDASLYRWALYRLVSDKSVGTFARLSSDNKTVVMRGKRHWNKTHMPAAEFFAQYSLDTQHAGIFGAPP